MSSEKCPTCGAARPPGAEPYSCPRCLLRLGSTLFDESTRLAEQTGDLIGPYKLIDVLGEGGFGIVWTAEQTKPVRRRVALKIINLGMDTREVVARFEAERPTAWLPTFGGIWTANPSGPPSVLHVSGDKVCPTPQDCARHGDCLHGGYGPRDRGQHYSGNPGNSCG